MSSLNRLHADSIISLDMTLHVATTGSDSYGDGTPTRPFASLRGAFLWLSAKMIAAGVWVDVRVAAGAYSWPWTTYLDHPNGDRIRVWGANLTGVAIDDVHAAVWTNPSSPTVPPRNSNELHNTAGHLPYTASSSDRQTAAYEDAANNITLLKTRFPTVITVPSNLPPGQANTGIIVRGALALFTNFLLIGDGIAAGASDPIYRVGDSRSGDGLVIGAGGRIAEFGENAFVNWSGAGITMEAGGGVSAVLAEQGINPLATVSGVHRNAVFISRSSFMAGVELVAQGSAFSIGVRHGRLQAHRLIASGIWTGPGLRCSSGAIEIASAADTNRNKVHISGCFNGTGIDLVLNSFMEANLADVPMLVSSKTIGMSVVASRYHSGSGSAGNIWSIGDQGTALFLSRNSNFVQQGGCTFTAPCLIGVDARDGSYARLSGRWNFVANTATFFSASEEACIFMSGNVPSPSVVPTTAIAVAASGAKAHFTHSAYASLIDANPTLVTPSYRTPDPATLTTVTGIAP